MYAAFPPPLSPCISVFLSRSLFRARSTCSFLVASLVPSRAHWRRACEYVLRMQVPPLGRAACKRDASVYARANTRIYSRTCVFATSGCACERVRARGRVHPHLWAQPLVHIHASVYGIVRACVRARMCGHVYEQACKHVCMLVCV